MAYGQATAETYDAIYEAMKDYAREAARLHMLIERYQQSGGTMLLDMACGTGLHDQHLQQWYQVEGADLSEAQLVVARKRLPAMTFHLADMTSFDLGKQYDIVTCLFSSIGHVTTLERMYRAISEMAKHLRPGGVLVVEPWIHPDDFVPGRRGTDFVELPDLIVARISSTEREGHICKLLMHHFVDRAGEVTHFVERHDAAMYTIDEYMDAFRAAGLKVWHDSEGLMGRGVFVGCKSVS